MSEYRTVMERDLQRVGRAGFSFDDLHRLRQRKRRNQRAQSAVIGLLVAVLAFGAVLYAFQGRNTTVPASGPMTGSNVGSLRLLQTLTVGDSVQGLATADGTVYVLPDRGEHDLLAFTGSCGERGNACSARWTADVPGELSPSMVASGGVLYVVGDELRAFSKTCAVAGGACDPLWTAKPAGTGGKGSLVAFGGTVVVQNFDAVSVFPVSCARHPDRCDPLWVSTRFRNHITGLAVDVGGAFVGSLQPDRNGPGPVYAMSWYCGLKGEECPPSEGWTPPGPAGAGFTASSGHVYLGSAITGLRGMLRSYPASCFARPGCHPEWEAETPGAVNSPPPVVTDGLVLVSSRFGADLMQAYPEHCGNPCRPVWTAAGIPDQAATPPYVQGGVVYVASETSGLRAYATDCGSDGVTCSPAWTWGDGSDGLRVPMRSVVATAHRVFAGSTDGKLYVFGIGVPPTSSDTGSDRATVIVYGALAAIAVGVVFVRRWRRKA